MKLFKKATRSYENIQELIDEGTENRTVAATNMNQTSSRAHTIVSIFLEQKKKGKNIIFSMKKIQIIKIIESKFLIPYFKIIIEIYSQKAKNHRNPKS